MCHTLVWEDVVTRDQNVHRILHIRVHVAPEHTRPAMEVLSVILVQTVGRSSFIFWDSRQLFLLGNFNLCHLLEAMCYVAGLL